MAVLISEKFNKFYDFTLIEYLEHKRPVIEDFVNGRFFGRYMETMGGGIIPGVEKWMLPCLEVDANPHIEKVGSFDLIEPLEKGSYGYTKEITEILEYYQADLPRRRRNAENFDKRPDQVFISDRLIGVKQIIKGAANS